MKRVSVSRTGAGAESIADTVPSRSWRVGRSRTMGKTNGVPSTQLGGIGPDRGAEIARERPFLRGGQCRDTLDGDAAEVEEAQDRAPRVGDGEGDDEREQRERDRDDERPPPAAARARARDATRRPASPATRAPPASARSVRSSSAIRLPQPVERTRRARLDGAAADAKRGGGLLLRELEQVAAREHEPRVVGQLLQRREQTARSSPDGLAASGDGAAPPETSCAARSVSAARLPAERRRFLASFATIWSSHGRSGAPRRKRPSARQALTSPSWTASSASAGLPAMRYATLESDLLMCAHELCEGAFVPTLRPQHEVAFGEWTALHRP